MVSLKAIQLSNSRIRTSLPPNLTAVFVGATSGIGEYSLKAFAAHAAKPRIYFVGRSQESGSRILAECKKLNSEGEYIFIKADTSLIKGVDDVCREIKTKEKTVNLLFVSTGTLVFGTKTEEGLHYMGSLVIHSRNRFILNLLPLLQEAKDLRRVVSVFTAGKEGQIFADDMQGFKVPMLSARGHASSVVTLSLEALAKKAPNVSFIHDNPGPVKTNLIRGGEGFIIGAVMAVSKVLAPFRPDRYIPNDESGERHLFLATSAMYPAGVHGDESRGVALPSGVQVAKGTDGEVGSGVYSIDQNNESTGPEVEALLAGLRKQGMVEKVWKTTADECRRITQLESV